MHLSREFGRVEENIWTNFRHDTSRSYVLFVGNHDFSELTDALVPTLSRRYGRPVEVIKVVGRIGNLDENIIGVHSNLDEIMETEAAPNKWLGSPSPKDIERLFQSGYFNDLLMQIQAGQSELFLDVFVNNVPQETLPQGVRVLAPPKELVDRLSDKFKMYDFLERNGFPMPRGYRVNGKEGVLEAYRSDIDKGIFIAKNSSASGSGCRIFHIEEDIISSNFLKEGENYYVKEFIDVVCSPSTGCCIGNTDDILVMYTVDQVLEDGTRLKGASFPSSLPIDIQDKINDLTFKIGKTLAKETDDDGEPYRGLVNLDFMVTSDGRVFVAEINPRKFGSVADFQGCYDHIKIEAEPSFAELHFNALTRDMTGLGEFDSRPENIHWARYCVKAPVGAEINHNPEGYMPTIADAFRTRRPAFSHCMGTGTKLLTPWAGWYGDLTLVSDEPFDAARETLRHEKIVKEIMGVE